ncbi:TenA family transcriptional regulator [Cobetia sp. L2A1]|uniref:TenA family transcriptional regulator n=1 Tax=Cobetia sp. L2A1 TaxID=2686360 RepID=UPI00131CE8BF|nr:iron-containing redox enzyme family protein [Cobetia sp. L2A1]
MNIAVTPATESTGTPDATAEVPTHSKAHASSVTSSHFHSRLLAATETERAQLLARPLIRQALSGEVSLPTYRAFLAQAYHHVRQTVSLMMACGSHLSGPGFAGRDWLNNAVAEYIEEEIGHERWVLNDLRAAGGDEVHAAARQPLIETELLVSYAYDSIARIHPLCMFGMVLVLEGTSTAVATQAGQGIRDSLGLPEKAFTYLFSHGELDISHMEFFAALMNRIELPDEQDVIIHAARVFYRLYGDMLDAVVRDADHWSVDAIAQEA